MRKTWRDKLIEKMPPKPSGEDGNHVLDIDYSVAWMVWHEYRDYFLCTEEEYVKLIKPYFNVGDTVTEVVNKLWAAQLVEPFERQTQ